MSLGAGQAARPDRAPRGFWPAPEGVEGAAVFGPVPGPGDFEKWATEEARATAWQPANPHAFNWLNGMAPDAIAEARPPVTAWLEAHASWTEAAWRLDTLADRLINWLVHFDALTDGAEAAFAGTLSGALMRQARHLLRWSARPGEAEPFTVLHGAILCALVLPGHRRRLGPLSQALERVIADKVNADGGHHERHPDRHAATLARLVHLRERFADAHVEVPAFLQNAIDRMAPLLRALLHGDGHLALFNGCAEGDAWVFRHVLEASGSSARATASATHTGYQRLAARRTLVIMETGAPRTVAPWTPGHAGTLSFEMSVAKQRIIVNCGAIGDSRNPLAAALRGTAAHSTLVVADTHSADLTEDGAIGARRPRNVRVRRREMDRNVLVEASHDGYAEPFGLTHFRSLYMARDGLELRGEDALDGPGGGVPFQVRFHLHPTVQASSIETPGAALVRLPTGRFWRFTAEGGALSLEESIYVGGGGRRRSDQLVIAGEHTGPRTVVKWRLNRE